MRASLSRFSDKEKGATAVEFAIVLPVLLLIIFGVFEWGLYMFNRQVITNAVREGARYGTLMRMPPEDEASRNEASENNDICKKVIEKAGNFMVTFGGDVLMCDPDPEADITRNPPTAPFKFETELTVEVDYEYEFLFLSLPPLNIGPLTITSKSTMRME